MAQTAKQIARWAESKEIPSQEVLLLMTQHLPIPEGKRKVIAVNMLPMSADMTDKAKAEMAGVTPRYYYMLTHDPEFNALMTRETRQMFAIKTPQCANKYLNVALNGDRQALERVLEQQGVLDPPQKNINIQGAITTA